jgi:predicted esterase
VFFGSGDPDPHVPWVRVQQSIDILTSMNGAITARRYPGMPHTINSEELEIARTMLQAAFPHP